MNHHMELGSVAVISPYRAQLAVLRSAFGRPQSNGTTLRPSYAAALADVEFSTVDGFQVASRPRQPASGWRT